MKMDNIASFEKAACLPAGLFLFQTSNPFSALHAPGHLTLMNGVKRRKCAAIPRNKNGHLNSREDYKSNDS